MPGEKQCKVRAETVTDEQCEEVITTFKTWWITSKVCWLKAKTKACKCEYVKSVLGCHCEDSSQSRIWWLCLHSQGWCQALQLELKARSRTAEHPALWQKKQRQSWFEYEREWSLRDRKMYVSKSSHTGATVDWQTHHWSDRWPPASGLQ